MAYYPAEFARKGLELLHDLQDKLSQESYNHNALATLLSTYDKQVAELVSKREEKSQREYKAQAISYFYRGAVLSFLAVLLGAILYGVIRGAHIPLQETALVAIIAGLSGGAFVMVSRAPRDMEYAETKDPLFIQLYQDPKSLTTYYGYIKGPYERKIRKPKPVPSGKKEEEKQKDASLKRRVRVRKELKDGMVVATVRGEDRAKEEAPDRSKGPKQWFAKLWRPPGEERKKREFSMGFLRSVAERRATEGTKTKVLIIGDRDETPSVKGDPLEERFEVVMAESSLLGIQKAVAESPQAIILDMESSEDGYETCRKLTEHEATSGIPILVWTERAGREEILRAREAGASDCIAKGAEDTDGITAELQSVAERIEKAIASQEKPIEKLLSESIRQEPAEEEGRVGSEQSTEEDERAGEVEQAVRQEAVSSAGRILVVSDNEAVNGHVRRLSGEGHYSVFSLNEAEKVIRTALAERPDVILLDGGMQEINSLNMYKILRARMSSTPVVMLLDPHQEYRTQEVGVSEYLIKPFVYEELAEKLEHILG